MSSRSSKKPDGQDIERQRIENFMDDEDLADAAEAQTLQTKDAYTGFGSTAHDERRKGLLMDLVPTRGETMGVKLLRKMGWKDGQGIGARIRRHARLDDNDKTSNTVHETHLFAPSDCPMISFVKKNDSVGLGFTTIERLHDMTKVNQDRAASDEENSAFHSAGKPERNKGAISVRPTRSGFGTGVLNDNGSDEDDPYEVGPRISYNRMIGDDKRRANAKTERTVSVRTSNPSLKTKPVYISKKANVMRPEFRRCHDGRLALDGFVLSEAMNDASLNDSESMYPRPEIPKGWQSAKTRATSTRTRPQYQSSADAAKQSKLDPKSRGAILGESVLPGKSVFDYLSTTARDRIASATGRADLPAAGGEAPMTSSTDGETHATSARAPRSSIPDLDKEIALAALGRGTGGWMPYADDDKKRARYRTFLEFRAGISTKDVQRPAGLDREQWLHELQEFAHAAQVFKPLTGMMASRFTTSSTHPISATTNPEQTLPLLSTPSFATAPSDPAEAAAKMGMFGPLTRSSLPFYPTRLLCKRFNVRPPDNVQPDSESAVPTTGDTGSRARPRCGPADLVSKSVLQEMLRESAVGQSFGANRESTVQDVAQRPPEPAAEDNLIDPTRNEALDGEKAGEAVFKAIFGDDSD